MGTHYPYIISTVERIVYDVAKNYYQLEKDDIAVSVSIALQLGSYTFKNHLGFPILFTYKNDLFIVKDESIMFTRSFNLLPEYAKMDMVPTLSHFINLKPELYTVHEKTLPKHRRMTPKTVDELISDIETYFDVDAKSVRQELPRLLNEHSVFIQDKLLQKNYGLTIEVDNLSYASLSITRTHIRPRRRFSHYVIDYALIKEIIALA